ncbi:MAG: hypothetical protein CMJ81_20015 [Planctomycetaceae bacterium]|nr:hypothetical protein [Planctomycetaceae bacterium]MBP63239.1 hypothetical protein [Planctomycetaceae bacterium]
MPARFNGGPFDRVCNGGIFPLAALVTGENLDNPLCPDSAGSASCLPSGQRVKLRMNTLQNASQLVK